MNIEISKKQYYIHIIFELIAILIVVPIVLTYLITKWLLIPQFYRYFFISVILLTLVVDGYLLIKWFSLIG